MKYRVTSAYQLLEEKLGLSVRLLGAGMFLTLRLVWMSLLVFLTSKALTKMILRHHRIGVPRFAVFPLDRKVRRPKRLEYPLLVKSLTEEGSVGISQASIVYDDDKLADAGLTTDQLSTLLRDNGVVMPGGTLTEGDRTWSVELGTSLDDIAALRDLPLVPPAGAGQGTGGAGTGADAAAGGELAQDPSSDTELPAGGVAPAIAPGKDFPTMQYGGGQPPRVRTCHRRRSRDDAHRGSRTPNPRGK
jgi:hypothetical protein